MPVLPINSDHKNRHLDISVVISSPHPHRCHVERARALLACYRRDARSREISPCAALSRDDIGGGSIQQQNRVPDKLSTRFSFISICTLLTYCADSRRGLGGGGGNRIASSFVARLSDSGGPSASDSGPATDRRHWPGRG